MEVPLLQLLLTEPVSEWKVRLPLDPVGEALTPDTVGVRDPEGVLESVGALSVEEMLWLSDREMVGDAVVDTVRVRLGEAVLPVAVSLRAEGVGPETDILELLEKLLLWLCEGLPGDTVALEEQVRL